MFAFNTLLLYDYYYIIATYMYVHGIICAVPGFYILEYQLLDIVISTCFMYIYVHIRTCILKGNHLFWISSLELACLPINSYGDLYLGFMKYFS